MITLDCKLDCDDGNDQMAGTAQKAVNRLVGAFLFRNLPLSIIAAHDAICPFDSARWGMARAR